MPPLSRVLLDQRVADAGENGLHPNTLVPRNWTRAGNVTNPLRADVCAAGGLCSGPELAHVFQSVLRAANHVVVYTDALGRLLQPSKRWRKGLADSPDELQLWVVGPFARTTLASHTSADEEAAYQARLDRTDPARIAQRRLERQQEREELRQQRRQARRHARRQSIRADKQPCAAH